MQQVTRATPGALFRQSVRSEKPLQVVGAVNAYSAKLAQQSGFAALYLSGAGVANASFGLPDLGMTSLVDVCEDARRITGACPLPLLVDADTGFGHALMIARAVSELERAGVAAMHIEDQVEAKRCGHRPGKQLVTCKEMCDRLKAASDARTDPDFVIMARTDAFANEGLNGALERSHAYVESGADMIFAEALHDLSHFEQFCRAVQVPVLANITEFGKTPLFSLEELKDVGVGLVLYPLSAFRAMNKAALAVYGALRAEGTQSSVLETMQTRDELYETLDYRAQERLLDSFTGG